MTTRTEVAALYAKFAEVVYTKRDGVPEEHLGRYGIHNASTRKDNPFKFFAEQGLLQVRSAGYSGDTQLYGSGLHTYSYCSKDQVYIPCYMVIAHGTNRVLPDQFLNFVVAASFPLWAIDRTVQISVSQHEDEFYADWIKFAEQYEDAVITKFTRQNGRHEVATILFPVTVVGDLTVTRGKV